MTLPVSPMRDAIAACAAPLETPAACPVVCPAACSAAGKDVPRETSASHCQRTYCFPATSLVFAGHFPGQPVLPAVVQTLMAQMTVEEALAHGDPQSAFESTAQHALPNASPPAFPHPSQSPFLRLLAVTQAKFTAVLGPNMPITVQVRPAAKADHWNCTLHACTTPQGEATLAAKIQLHMERIPAPHEVHA